MAPRLGQGRGTAFVMRLALLLRASREFGPTLGAKVLRRRWGTQFGLGSDVRLRLKFSVKRVAC